LIHDDLIDELFRAVFERPESAGIPKSVWF
jgi:hypothetical protein